MTITRRLRVGAGFLGGLIGLMILAAGPAQASSVQEDWEHCLLSVLYKFKKKGAPAPATPLELTCVGMGLTRGYDGPRNPVGATPYFQRAAQANFPSALVMLSHAYSNGYGLPKDQAQSNALLRKAAELGNSDGMLTLAEVYFRGLGVKPDAEAAKKWVRAAMDQNNRAAWTIWQKNFAPGASELSKAADVYSDRKYGESAKFAQLAADQGNARGQFLIGWQLDKGEGMQADPARGATWYRKAADQGDGEAAAALGKLYEDAHGVREDWVEAAKWYKRAAELGDPMGTFLYGRAFQCGIGVAQHRGWAIEWFWRAEARGHPEGGRWGRWLRGEGNDPGVCSQAERDMVGMISVEPVGVAFRTSRERMAWLSNAAANARRVGEWVDWSRRDQEYQTCQRNGGSNCRMPGVEPPRP